ncbi:MAG: ferrous iron transport protein [Candidatus Midichloriaceae bacterium]|jgi:ferrous iron transport protein B|nr:ferrous iron transport protein [Candidatus Midichloriaceae bacterium]
MTNFTEPKKMRVALIGAPNTGKTSLFNLLTDLRQSTGNWSGVTMQKNCGDVVIEDQAIEIIDFPGAYTISTADDATSEQKILVNSIIRQEFELIVNVVDILNLERNLYLTAQLADVRRPMIVVLNFADKIDKYEAEKCAANITKKLGVFCAIVSAKSGFGIDKLKKLIITNKAIPVENKYPKQIADIGSNISSLIANKSVAYFLTIKALEERSGGGAIADVILGPEIQEARAGIKKAYGEDAENLIISARLLQAKKLTTKLIGRPQKNHWVDRLVFGNVTGPLILAFMMLFMFTFSINVGGVFQDSFELVARAIFIDFTSFILEFIHAPQILHSLISAGLGGGITTVAAFIPIIASLYLVLSFLEDCGYLSRAALLVSGLLKKIGLPGIAFIPLIVGFGCNVPAIASVPMLESRKAQIKTAIIAPFMSCSARLAVYSLFCAAFFKNNAIPIVCFLYILGIAVALFTALLLNLFLGKDEEKLLILELPRYQFPSIKHLFKKAFYRLNSFLYGAGKTIVMVFILVQMLSVAYVALGKKINFAEPQNLSKCSMNILRPMGLTEEQWPLGVSLVTGILAKEVVIGTLSALYSHEAIFDYPENRKVDAAINSLSQAWTLLKYNVLNFSMTNNFFELHKYEFDSNEVATDATNKSLIKNLQKNVQDKKAVIAYLIFMLLYFPCVSVFAAIKQQIGTRWAIFSAVWSTTIAYALAVGFYNFF